MSFVPHGVGVGLGTNVVEGVGVGVGELEPVGVGVGDAPQGAFVVVVPVPFN